MVLDEQGMLVAGASLAVHEHLGQIDEPEAYVAYGLKADGVVAAPARVIVHPAHRGGGIAQQLLDTQDTAARKAGATLAVRQASPAMRRLLERRGWCYHGPGPADPRFPGTEFSVMSLDLRQP
jgi:GNAT superfamily N-acetyltransferase